MENLGYRPDATHTKGPIPYPRSIGKLDFTLVHPPAVIPSVSLDSFTNRSDEPAFGIVRALVNSFHPE